MNEPKKITPARALTKLISDSSQKILAAFIDDDIKIKEEQEKIKKQVEQAIKNNNFVVLHVTQESGNPDSYETLAGKLYQNKMNPQVAILRIDKTKEIRMIPIIEIKKISLLQAKGTNQSLAK